jgi:hypothetical protein
MFARPRTDEFRRRLSFDPVTVTTTQKGNE